MGTRSTIQPRRVGDSKRRSADDRIRPGSAEGSLRSLIGKLQKIECECAVERGPFTVFGLFLRQDAPNRWDLVVSTGESESGRHALLVYLTKKLTTALTTSQRILISRIVTLDRKNRFIQDVLNSSSIEHGLHEIGEGDFGDVPVERAFVITSHKPTRTKRAASVA